MTDDHRRHDEAAYENLRTLEALTDTDMTVVRVYNLLRLMTWIRLNHPLVWQAVVEARRLWPGK